MKKLLVLLLASVMLCACGNEDVITTNSCYTEESSMNTVIDMSATNDEIDKVVLTMKPDNSLFGVDSLSILTDDQKEQVKASMLTTLGLEDGDNNGLNIDIQINDTMIIVIEADLKVADAETLKKIGLDFDGQDMSLENNVAQMKEDGYTCEK